MPRPKGLPKTGGRMPGVPNRTTQDLMKICESRGIVPFEKLLELADHQNPSIQLAALREVCGFLYPKRRPIEMADEVNASEPISRESMDRIKNLVAAIRNDK